MIELKLENTGFSEVTIEVDDEIFHFTYTVLDDIAHLYISISDEIKLSFKKHPEEFYENLVLQDIESQIRKVRAGS